MSYSETSLVPSSTEPSKRRKSKSRQHSNANTTSKSPRSKTTKRKSKKVDPSQNSPPSPTLVPSGTEPSKRRKSKRVDPSSQTTTTTPKKKVTPRGKTKKSGNTTPSKGTHRTAKRTKEGEEKKELNNIQKGELMEKAPEVKINSASDDEEIGDYQLDGSGDELVMGDDFMGDYDEFNEDIPEDDFQIIPKNKVESLIDEEISKAQQLLDLKPEYAALVLQYFGWNMETLQDKYFDNPEKCVEAAGVKLKPVKFKEPKSDEKVECLVCLDEVPYKNTYNLPCGHRFYCLQCWKAYLDDRFHSAGNTMATHTSCMTPKCSVRVGREGFKRLATPEIYQKFSYFFTKSYVETNKQMTYCPNGSCGNAIKYSGSGKPNDVVECSCSYRFCFACGRENHKPVTCADITTWEIKNTSDDESEKYVRLISKPCFHCKRMTERTEGCNHMNCRLDQGGCGKHWCWMCGGDWATHGEHTGGYYSCNKYEESDRFKIDQENTKVKSEFERFQFYYTRFFEHGVNEKDATNHRSEMKQKKLEYSQNYSINPEFLTEALEVLIQCRHALKYTYVFAYFLPQTHKFRPLFEDQQTNLEAVTEKLASIFFHTPMKDMVASTLKNQTKVAENFMKRLIKSFEEEFNKD